MAIRVELELADGRFVTRMLHAGESIAQFNANLLKTYPGLAKFSQAGLSVVKSIERSDNVTKGFLSTLRDVAIVAGIASMGIQRVGSAVGSTLGGIVRVNSEFQNMMMLMQGMSKSSDPAKEAKESIAGLYKEASKVPFSLKEIQSASVKLKASGLDPMAGSFRAVADAVAAMGGGDEKLERVTLAIAQMSGKGVIQMEELRQQLGEALPEATALMARSMGVTYADLMKEIATGTVKAKPALEKLFLELDRTYGGSSQRMMSTFSGQMKLSSTLFQKLALRFGEGQGSGTNTFFGALGKQLADINTFLASPQAAKMADLFNKMLVGGVENLRMLVDKVIEFRQEILIGGKMAIMTFGIMIGTKGILGMVNMVKNFTMSWKAANLELAKTRQKMQEIVVLNARGTARNPVTGRMNSAAQLSAAGYTVASSNIQRATMRMNSGFQGFLSKLGNVPGYVGAAAAALSIGAAAFDFFGSAAKGAWEELETFGAKSRQQVDEAYKYVQELKRKLNHLKNEEERKKVRGGVDDNFVYDMIFNRKKQMADLEKEIAGLDAKLPGFKGDADLEEARVFANEKYGIYEKMVDKIRSMRNIEEQARAEAYSKELEAARELGNDTTEIITRNGDKKIAADIAFYDEKLSILKGFMKEADEYSKRPGQSELNKLKLKGVTDLYREELIKLSEAKNSTLAQSLSVEKFKGGDSPEELLKKGETLLANMKKEASGLRSELGGASSEAGELAQAIKDGDFGPEENAKVKKLIKDLKEAQEEADALKEAMKFMNDSQSLYDSSMTQIQSDTYELLSKNKSPEEIYLMKQKQLEQGLSTRGRSALTSALTEIKRASDQTNSSVTTLFSSFTEKLFGTDTSTKGKTVVGILDQMVQRVEGIVGAINRAATASFGGASAGMSFNGPMASGPKMEDAINKGFLDLIAYAEGTDKGRGYNETLGYGAFTGGPVELISMSLREVLELQKKMLAHPDNDFNSSAAGRYQIVSKTLESLIAKLGLSKDQKFTRELQDQLATELAKGRGNNPNDLRNEWEGLRRISDEGIARALSKGMGVGGSRPVQTMIQDQDGNSITTAQAARNLRAEQAIKTTAFGNDFLADQKQKLMEILDSANDVSSAYEKLRASIRAGDFGEDRNPEAEKYKKYFAAIKKVEQAEKDLKTHREATNDVENGIEKNTKDITAAARELENVRNASNKNPYAGQAEALQQIIDKYDLQIERARIAAGGRTGSAFERTVLAQKKAEIDLFNKQDVQSTLNALRLKREGIESSVGTEREIRSRELNEAIAEQRRYVTNFKGSEVQRQAVVWQVESNIALLRKKNAQETRSQFGQQMTQWADIQKNMDSLMTNWASGLADGLTSMIMGEKVDWKGMLKKQISDVINMGIKYFMGSMLQGKGQIGGMMQNGAKAPMGGMGGMSGAKSAMGGKGGFGIAHTGGIIGKLSATKSVHPAAFLGARFHTGGIIKALGVGPDEVPMIAKKGEGIFTPEQMKAMGSTGGVSQTISVSTNVNVNANGGDAKQNDDMAKKVAKEVEGSIRGLVFKEIQQQKRAGNSMNAMR